MIEGIVLIVSVFIVGPALIIAWDEWRNLRYQNAVLREQIQTYRKERNVYRIR